MIEVTVVYGAPERQVEISLSVPPNCTVELAINRSCILAQFPEIKLDKTPVGINSRREKLDAPLQDGDRIEIYRPLIFDPKEARRQRVRSQ